MDGDLTGGRGGDRRTRGGTGAQGDRPAEVEGRIGICLGVQALGELWLRGERQMPALPHSIGAPGTGQVFAWSARIGQPLAAAACG
jgi:hypothetical protein